MMNDCKINAQVHRFRDLVALSLGTGETVYLEPRDVRKLTRALNRTAKSCETEMFVNSTAGTHEFTFYGRK